MRVLAVVPPLTGRDNSCMKTQQNFAKPQGIVVFPTLPEAVRNGFEVYERSRDGYLVRTRTEAGWALALVREVKS